MALENINTETYNSGNNTSAVIDESILNNLQSNGNYSDITAQDMISYVPDDLSPEMKNQLAQQDFMRKNASPGPLPIEQYYPGISDPIAKGNYSGSVIGSTTLFAPGAAMMPYGVVAAREKAIQDASMKRMSEIDNFQKQFQAPVTKHSSVQKNLNDLYYSGLQQWVGNAKKKYGQDWSSLLQNDINFQKWNRSMNTLKEQEDFMVDRVAGLKKEIDSGKFVATPELSKAMDDFFTGVKGLAQGPGNTQGYGLADSVLAFNTEYELNKVLNEAAKDIKYGVAERYGINKGDPNYDTIVSTKIKSVEDAVLRDAAKRTKEQLYPNSKYVTEEKLYRGLKNFFPGESEKQIQTVSKREPEGAEEVITENDFAKEPSIENVDYMMQGGKTNQEQIAGYYGVTFKKPQKLVLSTGTRIQYPQEEEGGTISQSTTKGPQNAVVSATKVYEVIDNPGSWEDGRVVTAQRKLRDPNIKTRHEVMSSGYFIEEQVQKDPETGKPITDDNDVPIRKKVQVPFYVPAKDIENAITKRTKSGEYQSGVPLDKLQEKAVEMNKGKRPFETKVDTETNKTVIVPSQKSGTGKKYAGIDPATGKPIFK